MPDIFLSYSSADRAKAMAVEKCLSDAGYSVFWDQETPPGRDWDDWIREKLSGAKVVLVLWSKTSVASPNVRHEAMIARDAGKLIPLLVDQLAPSDFPMGLYLVQAVQLQSWNGDAGDPSFHRLLEEIAARKNEPAPARRAPRQGRRGLLVALGFGVIVAAIAGVLLMRGESTPAETVREVATSQETATAALLGAWRWDGIECGDGPTVTLDQDLFVFTTAGAPTYQHVLETVTPGSAPTITTLVVAPEEARGTGYVFRREGDRLLITNRADGRTDEWEKCS